VLSGTIDDLGLINASSGTVTLSGARSGAGAFSASAGAVLDLTAGGTLNNTVSGAGTLKLDSGTYTVAGAADTIAKLAVDSSATLSGTGTISSAIADGGTIIASGGKLLLSGALTGTGALQATAGATLDLTAGGSLTEAISGAGTLELGGAYTLSAPLTVAALVVDAGASLSGSGTLSSVIADAGTLAATSGTLALAGAISGAGKLAASAGATVDILGGGTLTGALTGIGTIRIDSALTLNLGASLSATTIIDTANLTLGASEKITNLAGHNFTITAASSTTTLSLTGAKGDRFTNAGTLTTSGLGKESIGVAFINSGNVMVGSQALTFLGGVTNNGTINAATGGTTFNAAVGGTGKLEIGSAATLYLVKGAAVSQTVDFLSGTGLLDLAHAATFKGTIDGFLGADTIRLVNTPETGFSFANGVLTVMNNSLTVATLHFGGTHTTADFKLGSDGHGGTFITHS
jgi:fibronectin-binding autotransporter adhesin